MGGWVGGCVRVRREKGMTEEIGERAGSPGGGEKRKNKYINVVYTVHVSIRICNMEIGFMLDREMRSVNEISETEC